MLTKLIALVKDIVAHPSKYRKAAIVPAAVLVFVVSTYSGANSTVTLEVTSLLATLGVFGIPNNTAA